MTDSSGASGPAPAEFRSRADRLAARLGDPDAVDHEPHVIQATPWELDAIRAVAKQSRRRRRRLGSPQFLRRARSRGAGPPPVRRTRKSRSRAASRCGDSGDPDLDGESAPPWLPGHGDTEGIGDPPPDPIPNFNALVALGAAIDQLRGTDFGDWF